MSQSTSTSVDRASSKESSAAPSSEQSDLTLLQQIVRFAYRRFRAAKIWCLEHPSNVLSTLFFHLLRMGDPIVSRTPKPNLEDFVFKQFYQLKFGLDRPFVLKSDRPVAYDSHDHLWPRGAFYDSSKNRNFNLKLYHFLGHCPTLQVMDLGCAGGGFVRSLLEDGFSAVGVEGSDVAKKLRLGEWDRIPLHLLNADITHPFTVVGKEGHPARFQCITAWEVLEHIPKDKLPILLANIRNHLDPQGIFVGSVDMCPDGSPLTGAVYHLTLESKAWWVKFFNDAGFEEVIRHPFTTRDYVRGHGMGLKNWDPADGHGFHIVMRLKESGH